MGNWVCQLHKRKTLIETQFEVKTTIFALVPEWESSQATKWIDGWKILDTHIVTWSQVQLASSIMSPV
jgi:hypothetical protein